MHLFFTTSFFIKTDNGIYYWIDKNRIILLFLQANIHPMENTTLFKTYYDETLDRCGFSPELQKGILFFLGASIITNNADQIMRLFKDDLRVQEELHILIRLYATPNQGYDDISDLETTPLSSAILTYNHIVLHQILNQENQFDKQIKQNPSGVSILNDAHIIEDWADDFKDAKYTIATLHRLNKKFFEYIGQYLTALNLDHTQAYAAGITFYQKYQAIDFDGTSFLNFNILDTLSPVFKALLSYSVLYRYYPQELNANHFFSSILQFFYISGNREIAKPIHQFHHNLFYTNNPRKVRREWNFEIEKRGVIISQIMHNAMNIRRSQIGKQHEFFIKSDQYILNHLKDVEITKNDFKVEIQQLLENYYEIKIDEIVKDYTHAEFLQACAILFYETCAHAMIIKDFKPN